MLEIRDVGFTRPGGLSFSYDITVAAGEILAVQGPSGVGKTTLLDLIAGFEQPASGSISWNGQDFLESPPWERPVTTVFQSDNLFTHLTCLENVSIGLAPRQRGDHAAINSAFARSRTAGRRSPNRATKSAGFAPSQSISSPRGSSISAAPVRRMR